MSGAPESAANRLGQTVARASTRPVSTTLLIVGLLLTLPLRAHDIFSSWTDARLLPDRLELTFTLARSSALSLLGDGNASPPITPENFREYAPRLHAVGPELFEIIAAGSALPVTSVDALVSGDADVEFRLVYPRVQHGPLRITAVYLRHLVDGHVGTIVVSNAAGKDIGWSPVTVDQPSLDVALPPAESGGAAALAVTTPRFGTFLKLGVHHILIGYDHLLFLFGLIIACRRFATMVGIITCFTLAHSVTLALAAFDVVTLSPRIVEPLIAATIVFVGVENLLVRGREPKRRWLLTLVFGLVHGFGFAGALKEIGHGLSGRAIALPLFSFNLGVELGQLVVAGVCVPLLIALRRHENFERYGPPVVSSLVAVAGAFWFLQRTMFS